MVAGGMGVVLDYVADAAFAAVARAFLAGYADDLTAETLKLTNWKRFDGLDSYTDGLDFAIDLLRGDSTGAPPAAADQP